MVMWKVSQAREVSGDYVEIRYGLEASCVNVHSSCRKC